MKENGSAGEQSEAPRRRWKPGLEQHPEQENQGSQHMLQQPKGSFPDSFMYFSSWISTINSSQIIFRNLGVFYIAPLGELTKGNFVTIASNNSLTAVIVLL